MDFFVDLVVFGSKIVVALDVVDLVLHRFKIIVSLDVVDLILIFQIIALAQG